MGAGTVNWAGIAAAIAPASGPGLTLPTSQQAQSSVAVPQPAAATPAAKHTPSQESGPAPRAAPVGQKSNAASAPQPAAPASKPSAKQAAPVPQKVAATAKAPPAAPKRKATKKKENDTSADEIEPPAKKRKSKKKEAETPAEETEPADRAKPSKKRKGDDAGDAPPSKKIKSAEVIDTEDEEDAPIPEGVEHEDEGDLDDLGVSEVSPAPDNIDQAWYIRYHHAKHDIIHKAYGAAGSKRCGPCALRNIAHCWTVPGLKCQACRHSKIKCDRDNTVKPTGEKTRKIPKNGSATEPKGMFIISSSHRKLTLWQLQANRL